MRFKKGKWYKTSDGFNVEFVRDIEEDGQYNVFRRSKDLEYKPYYTDVDGCTAYGARILSANPKNITFSK